MLVPEALFPCFPVVPEALFLCFPVVPEALFLCFAGAGGVAHHAGAEHGLEH